jgi:hypothetical protein
MVPNTWLGQRLPVARMLSLMAKLAERDCNLPVPTRCLGFVPGPHGKSGFLAARATIALASFI